eukprot:7376687-Lingulodinium_polyedra.AAC.1
MFSAVEGEAGRAANVPGDLREELLGPTAVFHAFPQVLGCRVSRASVRPRGGGAGPAAGGVCQRRGR